MAGSPALPPGPRWPRAVQTLHYGLDPDGFFASARRAHGDVFTVRVMSETWVVLAHPGAVSELYGHGPGEASADSAIGMSPGRHHHPGVIFIAMNRDRTSILFILFSAETVL